jgi:DNA-binding FadR family transcriptional regulator
MIYDANDRNRLPRTASDAAAIPLASLGIEALYEALAMGANDAARRAMARMIAQHGRKYTAAARTIAADIGSGKAPLPTR